MAGRNRQSSDYYGTLGVPPEASADDIRRAYRRLALEWHPDRNPDNAASTQKFQELSEAYAVLSDPLKRREYDEFRRLGSSGAFGYSREDLFRDMFASKSASAIFEEIAREFERMGMRVDRHYFEQTLFGGRAFVAGGVFIISPLTPLIGAFRLARLALKGIGAASGLAARHAEQIPGVGSTVSSLGRLGRWLLGIPAEPVDAQSISVPGDLTLPLRLTCEEGAEGVQKRISVPRGGNVEELLVLVPRGVSHGTKLRLRGKGNVGPKGPPGDLYLRIEIAGAEQHQG